jgi:DNA-binding beta-propeller fold protein YncE
MRRRQCIARTKSLDRCKNNIEHGHILFCRKHRWWGIVTLSAALLTITTIFANLGTIFGTSLVAVKTPRPLYDYTYYMFVLDASEKMKESFDGKSKWDVALESLNTLLLGFNSNAHYGLVVLGGEEANSNQDPCQKPSDNFPDFNSKVYLQSQIDSLRPAGGGSIYKAYALANSRLESLPPDAIRTLVFITSSIDTCQNEDEWDSLSRFLSATNAKPHIYGEIIVLDENGFSPKKLDELNNLSVDLKVQVPQNNDQIEQSVETAVTNVTNFVADIKSGKMKQIIQINLINGAQLDWIDANNWLVIMGNNNVSIIDAKTAQVIHEIDLNGKMPVSMAVAGQHLYILLNDIIKVFDIETFKTIKTISPITGGATSIAASPDGKMLALGISDNKTQLISPEDGSVVRTLRSNYGGWAVTFSPDSKLIVAGTSQGILMWESSTGVWLPTSGGQDKTIKSLVFSHDGKTIAGGGRGFIYLWNVENGEIINFVEDDRLGEANSIDFSPDDSLLVSGTDDGIVRIWDVDSASLLRELTGHTSGINGVSFSPNGYYIASVANDQTIRIWGLP